MEAERCAEDPQLPLAEGEVEGQMPEAPPVTGDGPRAGDRTAEGLVRDLIDLGRGGLRRRLHAHGGIRSTCPLGARLIDVCTGRSTSPPSAAGPVTTKEALPSKRSIT